MMVLARTSEFVDTSPVSNVMSWRFIFHCERATKAIKATKARFSGIWIWILKKNLLGIAVGLRLQHQLLKTRPIRKGWAGYSHANLSLPLIACLQIGGLGNHGTVPSYRPIERCICMVNQSPRNNQFTNTAF